MYYTPQEAQQTATDLGLQDAGFNVQFHFYDGVDEWQLYLRLDLDKYDPWVDELSEPAEWAWSLEEPPPVATCRRRSRSTAAGHRCAARRAHGGGLREQAGRGGGCQ